MTDASASKRGKSERTPSISDLDVAIAHWHINAWGGAEYLVTKLAEVLQVDRIYTIGTPTPDESNPYGDIDFYDVTQDLSRTAFRQFQSRFGRVFEYALWEDVDWREYGHPDVLVTSGATTRAVITPDDTLHFNYCHSPPRWFYDLYHDRKNSLTGMLARPLIRYLRMHDASIDPRVDHYFANSPIIARRLMKYYDREAQVLYPPLDLDKYRNNGDEGFYLHLGRLDVEKGIEAVVEAFAGTDHNLVLAGGDGDAPNSVHATIDRMPNIEHRGFVPQDEKYDLLATCRAVVFNGQNEDFGIVPIEANASGKACLVRDEGFPGLFIETGQSGYLHDGTASSIRESVEKFEENPIQRDPTKNVADFGMEVFEEKVHSAIVDAVGDFAIKIEH